MLHPAPHNHRDDLEFPRQKVLCDGKPFSHDLLHSLLDAVYEVSLPFTGYLQFAGGDGSLLFLFFFNGTPYAAGKFEQSKPVQYSIQDLGRQVAKISDGAMAVTLCETDPVLLKSMLLFLEKEPVVKAPPSLLDLEYIVRQIGEAGGNAMIALCRDKKVNFFFFKDGKGALVYYADLWFIRPDGMSLDEEMLLYAYQPGEHIMAYVFRDMITSITGEELTRLDKDSLYRLLTVGYLRDRRAGSAGAAPAGGNRRGDRRDDADTPAEPATDRNDRETDTRVTSGKQDPPGVVLTVESGPLAGEIFKVTLPCTIGRKECDLILADRLVSRRHAELKLVANRLIIEDLVSKNGVKVNGNKIDSCPLSPNDLISIGPVNLRITPE